MALTSLPESTADCPLETHTTICKCILTQPQLHSISSSFFFLLFVASPWRLAWICSVVCRMQMPWASLVPLMVTICHIFSSKTFHIPWTQLTPLRILEYGIFFFQQAQRPWIRDDEFLHITEIWIKRSGAQQKIHTNSGKFRIIWVSIRSHVVQKYPSDT